MEYEKTLLSEKVLHSFAEVYAGQIWGASPKGEIVFLNQEAMNYAHSLDVQIGTSIYALCGKGILMADLIATAIKSGHPVSECTRDGHHIHELFHVEICRDNDGLKSLVIGYSLNFDSFDVLSNLLNQELQTAVDTINSIKQPRKDVIIAESAVMKELLNFLERTSHYDSAIFIQGESGVGKDMIARFIHKHSLRRDQIYLPFNCAALPNELIESELFGYSAGSFTGASKEGKAGLFELADGGTLFLDEIGELSLAAQSKLLRTIESGEVRRVGDGKSRYVDVRLISATNRDLEAMVRNGTFREDLFYRINIIPINIPPLRQRTDDIIPLANYFLEYYNKKFGCQKYFSEGTLKTLVQYAWPGNVRELRNFVQQIMISTAGDKLTMRGNYLLPYVIQRRQRSSQEPAENTVPAIPDNSGRSMREMIKDYERALIVSTLKANQGNVAKSAQSLQMHTSALYRKISEYEIHVSS